MIKTVAAAYGELLEWESVNDSVEIKKEKLEVGTNEQISVIVGYDREGRQLFQIPEKAAIIEYEY